MIRIIFKKRCVFNRHKRVVGNITTLTDHDKAQDLIKRGLADEYKGAYPPNGKTKINLKDLK